LQQEQEQRLQLDLLQSLRQSSSVQWQTQALAQQEGALTFEPKDVMRLKILVCACVRVCVCV